MFTKLNSLKLAICSALALSCSAMSFRAAGADEVRALGAESYFVLTKIERAMKERCALGFINVESNKQRRLFFRRNILGVNQCSEIISALWKKEEKQSTVTYYTLAYTSDFRIADKTYKQGIIATVLGLRDGQVISTSSRPTTDDENAHFAALPNQMGCASGKCPNPFPVSPPPPAAQPSGPTLGTCPNSQTACGLSNGSQLCCKPGENCRPPTKANMHGKCEPANCDSNKGEKKCSDNTDGSYSWCCGKGKSCGDKNQRCKDQPKQDPTKDTNQPTQPPSPPAPPAANPNPPNVDQACKENFCANKKCAAGLVCDSSDIRNCKVTWRHPNDPKIFACDCAGAVKCVAPTPTTTSCQGGSEKCKNVDNACLTRTACAVAGLKCDDLPESVQGNLAKCMGWYADARNQVYKNCMQFNSPQVCDAFYDRATSPKDFCSACLNAEIA